MPTSQSGLARKPKPVAGRKATLLEIMKNTLAERSDRK